MVTIRPVSSASRTEGLPAVEQVTEERQAPAQVAHPAIVLAQAVPPAPGPKPIRPERGGVNAADPVRADDLRRRGVQHVVDQYIDSEVELRSIPSTTPIQTMSGPRATVGEARFYFFGRRDDIARGLPRDIAADAADEWVARNTARYKHHLEGRHDGYRALTITGMALAILREHAQGKQVDPRVLATAQRVVADFKQRLQDAHATPDEIERYTTKVGRDLAASTSGWEDEVDILKHEPYYERYKAPDTAPVQVPLPFAPAPRPRTAANPDGPVQTQGAEHIRGAIAATQEADAKRRADREAHGHNVIEARLDKGLAVGGTARSYG